MFGEKATLLSGRISAPLRGEARESKMDPERGTRGQEQHCPGAAMARKVTFHE